MKKFINNFYVYGLLKLIIFLTLSILQLIYVSVPMLESYNTFNNVVGSFLVILNMVLFIEITKKTT